MKITIPYTSDQCLNMEKAYTETESIYFQKNQHWHIQDSPWKATQILKMIQKNNLQAKTIAEIGCGAGEILNQLHARMNDKSIEFYGYDIAPDVVQFWETRKKQRLQYFLEDLNIKDIHFDILLMIDVFEHVEDYFGFIRKASSKATYKIYHIPLDITVLSIIRNMPMYLRNSVGHLHYFMKESALATLLECGQEIIDYTYTAGSLELNNKSLRSRLMNIPRSILFNIHKDWAVKLLGGYSLLVLTK